MHDYKRYCILYVDDEEMSLKYFSKTFGGEFSILTASSAAEGMRLIQERGDEIAVLLTDQRMPGEKGLQLIERARQVRPGMVRMLITAYADFGVTVDAVNLGNIFRYISKPIQVEDMRNTLRRAIEHFLLQRERDELLLEKLSVVQTLIITDRVMGLGVIAAGLDQRIRQPLDAVRCFLHQTPARMQQAVMDAGRLRDPSFWKEAHALVLGHARKIAHALSQISGAEVSPALSDEKLTDVEPAVRGALDKRREALSSAGISLAVDLQPDLPALRVNPVFFGKIFDLLIENELLRPGAVKSMQLSGVMLPEAGGRRHLQFVFSCDAPGMPGNALCSVFDPFSNQDSVAQAYGLNVLMLFFLVHHHAGSVRVEERHGGLVYRLEFPVAPPEARPLPEGTEDFITKVIMNDALWERLTSSN